MIESPRMKTRSSWTAGRVPSSLTGREIVACPPSRLSTAATTDAGLVVGVTSTVVVDTGAGAVVTTGNEPLSIGTAPSVAAVAVHAVTTSTAPASSGTDHGHLGGTGQVHWWTAGDASHRALGQRVSPPPRRRPRRPLS